jgi:hypothetical protein
VTINNAQFTMRNTVLGATGENIGTADDESATISESSTFATFASSTWAAMGISFRIGLVATRPYVTSAVKANLAIILRSHRHPPHVARPLVGAPLGPIPLWVRAFITSSVRANLAVILRSHRHPAHLPWGPNGPPVIPAFTPNLVLFFNEKMALPGILNEIVSTPFAGSETVTLPTALNENVTSP